MPIGEKHQPIFAGSEPGTLAVLAALRPLSHNVFPGAVRRMRSPLPSESIEERMRRTYLESARALVAAVEAKDPYTREHSMRVSRYAEGLAARLLLSAAEIDSIRTAALLHDIGKIGVPDNVLRKPGPLTPAEYALVKRHPAIAVEILGHASFFSAELPLILHHHEWYDGKGYPAGLADEAIPLGARVLCVADSIDAMLSPRSYKTGYDLPRVRRELKEFSGRQFDPHVAAVAEEWLTTRPEEFVRQV